MDAAQLKKIPLFANLTTDHLHKVGAIAAQKQLKANERVFQEGEVGTEMYIIASGKVRISKMVPGVGEEALAILEPGSYFGEMALIDDTPRSADATAHLACTLYVIQKADLEQLMFLHKDLAYELLWTFVRTLSARLRETNDKIKAFFALSARF
ncbi:MAG: cyclic nucleotide-binding domain-containing protein [Deltaproteobacteria bacterium]|nr:MAG: cyclic nucleotide-binding domain-containing protein [Deltaproteobacteria bacterium]